MKKIVSILIALVMMLSMGVVAFAEDCKDCEHVAAIGKEHYGTLEEALAVTEAGSEKTTITLLKDGVLHYDVNNGVRKTNATIVGVSQNVELTFTGLGTGSIDVSLENLTVVDKTCYSSQNGEGAWEFTYLELTGTNTHKNVIFSDGIMFNGEANITATNCTFVGHPNDSSELSTATMYAVWVSNGTINFNNCTFTGNRGAKVHECYGSNVNSVVFDGCIFDTLAEKPGIAIGSIYMNGEEGKYNSNTWIDESDTSIAIKNCVFYDVKEGDNGLYVYESDTDVKKFNFSIENSFAYVGDNQVYPKLPTDVEVEKPSTEVEVNEKFDEEVKEVATNIAETTQVSGLETVVGEYVAAIKTEEIFKEVDINEPTTVVIEPKVKVVVEEYIHAENEGDKAVLVLDITPVLDIFVKNDEETKWYKSEKIDTTGKEVVVTIELPEGFAEDGETLYVLHTKSDSKQQYEYECIVENSRISFVNENGFSSFEVSTIKTLINTTPEKEPVRDTVVIEIDMTGKADAEESEGEENPNTGAPVMIPVVAVLAVLSGAVISKK